jgi:hypothetical protein
MARQASLHSAPPIPAGFAGVLTHKWSYDFNTMVFHLIFGSSPAVADLGINNVPSPGEADADLEVFTGNDSPVFDPFCMGQWFLIDSRGAVEWTKCTQSDEPGASPFIADINQDCLYDVGGGTTSGNNLEIMDNAGNFRWYWPSTLIDGQTACDYWPSSVAAADLVASNPGLEIIGARNDGFVRVFSGMDGTLLWSKQIAIGTDCMSFWSGESFILSSPAIGDIDGTADADPEIVVGTNNKDVVALDSAGTILWEFPTGGFVMSSPALADLDNDGKMEIVVGSDDGKIYLIQGDKNANGIIDPAERAFYQTNGKVRSSAAIGDLDGDGVLEIVIGSMDTAVYALNYDIPTNFLSVKWTFHATAPVLSSPALANRNSSASPAKLSVYVGCDDYNVYLLDGTTGAMIDYYNTGGPVPTSPAVADIDGDGKLEVLVLSWEDGMTTTTERVVCLEDTGSSVTPRQIEWGKFRHDHMNTGRYGVAYPYLDPSCSQTPILFCDPGCYKPIECQGDSTQVTLDGSGSEGATTWKWEGPFDESPASGSTVTATFHGTGEFTVTLTVSNGTEEKTCETIITIQDTTPPALQCPSPFALDVDSSCKAQYNAPGLASDPCSTTAVFSNPPIPAVFEGLGDRFISYSAEDESGNVSVCDTYVTLVDKTPPVLTCPQKVTIEAGTACKAHFGDMAAATDNCCAEAVTSSPALPADFGLGTFTITYSAADDSGNSATCATTLEVIDKTPPTILCPGPVTLEVDAQCQAVYNLAPTTGDNCGQVALTSNPPLPAVLSGIGPHEIVFTAKDAAGNTASCTAVAVLVDKIPPGVYCPAPVEAEADANCKADVPILASATDNCPTPPDLLTCPDSPFRLGKTDVTVYAIDESGNKSSCRTSVTVVDKTPPDVICDLRQVFLDTDEGGDDETSDEGLDEGPDEGPDEGGDGIATDHYIVEFTSTDNCSGPCCEATLNGFPVANGQEVILRQKATSRVYIEYGKGLEPILVFEGPSFVLEVICADQAGNKATCEKQIGSDADEDSDDDEDSDAP